MAKRAKTGARTGGILFGVALIHGVYYVASGLWPLLSIESFYAVTGPKGSDWLTRTVGVLIFIVGAAFLTAAARRRFSLEITVIGVGAALGLAVINGVYVGVDRIPGLYLIDAILEVLFILGWFVGWRNGSPVDIGPPRSKRAAESTSNESTSGGTPPSEAEPVS